MRVWRGEGERGRGFKLHGNIRREHNRGSPSIVQKEMRGQWTCNNMCPGFLFFGFPCDLLWGFVMSGGEEIERGWCGLSDFEIERLWSDWGWRLFGLRM